MDAAGKSLDKAVRLRLTVGHAVRVSCDADRVCGVIRGGGRMAREGRVVFHQPRARLILNPMRSQATQSGLAQ